jgi:hypothetical protein
VPREVDEHLGGVADHSVDLDLHAVAQLGDRAPQLLLGLQLVLTLHVLEVLSGLPGHVGLDLGVPGRRDPDHGYGPELGPRPPGERVRAAQRLASPSLSMKATPIVFRPPLRVQLSGTTPKGHGAP